MTTDNLLSIRTKAIFSVLAIIIVLSSVFLLLSIKHQKEELARRIDEQKAVALRITQSIQEHTYDPYKKRIVSLASTKKQVITAFAQRDRELLKKAVSPFYETIRSENKFFYIMHFSLPDGTTFLRMHIPELYGDDISQIRPMVMQVHRDKKQLSGYEVGRAGLYYRVIQPVFSDEKYIGCLEFGIHYEQLLELLRKNVSPDVTIAPKKTNWLKADLVGAEKNDVSDYTLLPFHSSVFENIKEDIFSDTGAKLVEVGDRTYSIISNIELKNHIQKPVARVVLALDITNDLQRTNQFIRNVLFLTLGLLFSAALVLYFSFGKLLSKIFNLNQSLFAANHQLTESKSYVENIISSMSDGLLVTEQDGRIIQANRAFVYLMGCDQNDLINKQLFDLFEQPDQVKQLLGKSNDQAGLFRSERLLRDSEGGTIPVLLSVTNLGTQDQDLKRQVCIISDISARKETERILKSAHDELEVRVEERTRELAELNQALQKEMDERKRVEVELRQAQKMEAIGTLAGGIAHDFNNILSIILGYTELAKENAPPGLQIEKNLEPVLDAANRAKNLVKQILAFSRQNQVDRFPINAQPLIKEGLKMLRSSMPTTITITEVIEPIHATILADPTQIHQILMNLCTNAYQAMEETGGELSVSLKTIFIGPDEQKRLLVDRPGEYLELTVTDTGVGMGPDVIGKIFDPYFTTKETGKGTGMGLAIIHGIIKEYGGSITVESYLGKGTTFHVYLPVVEEDTVPELKEPVDIPRGNERILFIDDEELLAEMGKDMLERLGYQVTAQYSAVEALETLKNTPNEFDLVITDQTMPNITGSNLAQQMMRIRPDIPIILCTGYSSLIDENSAKALGIKEFALKPLTKEVIAKLIRKVLNGVV